jgi:lipoprotein
MKFYKVIPIAILIITSIFISGCNKDEKLYYSLAAENFEGSAHSNNAIYNTVSTRIQFESINLFSKERTFEDAKKIYESTLYNIQNTIQSEIENGNIVITESGSVDILLLSAAYGEINKKTEIRTTITFEPKTDN